MLIDMNATIAYKCSSCGTFEFFNISLFNLLQKKEYCYTCRCHESGIRIVQENNNYKIKLPCINCGNEHVFALSKKQIMSRELNVFCCPQTGIQQCFIGNDQEVRKEIDSLEKELDDLINMFGYDNYFKNTQVMFDALNKVHDIAEQGNLLCECGNEDIELILLSDKIHLMCMRCSAESIIHAASNEDLKNILLRKQILLMSKIPENIIFKK